MRKFPLLLLVLLLLIYGSVFEVWAESENKITSVYFYSPTCASCRSMSDFLDKFSASHKNLDLRKYDVSDLRYKSLLDKYNEAYNVSPEDEGIVPVVFIGDKYFTDEEIIRTNFEKVLNTPGVKTPEINNELAETHEKDIRRFKSFKTAGIFLAGIINGLNPCSLSMLLFFLSLLTVRKAGMLKIGISFISGKFLAYVLLGTILFRFLSILDFRVFDIFFKVLFAVVLLILIVMSIQDYFAAKGERYDKIRLQLPEVLRRFNHGVIKRVSGFANLKIILLLGFLLGMIISLGEFLCTGQIYLATIITIFQTNSQLSRQALISLFLYNLGVVLPLGILLFLVYKGKEIFEVSEVIRERLHIIKLVNALILTLFFIIVLLFF